ncbi:MAG: mechanosensitive ion channel family protein [Oscillospiraceae bacterium]|nr:mechanosensitive ion channel family protein [Oscillospiraceae bacterium]
MDFDVIIGKLLAAGEVLLKASIIAGIGILAIRIILQLVAKMLEKSKLEKAAHRLLKTVLKVLLYSLLALMVASSLGVDVTGIVALASVLTLAISLALQNMLANVFGGFTLLNTHPFGAGDFVEIAGQSGTVKDVGIAYTRLTTPDNKMISIPNSAVVAAQIVNYSCTGKRRVDIPITASYDAPVEKVEQALRTASQVPGILEDPAPFISVTEYGDSAISYVVRVWVKTEDYWDVHFAIVHNIKKQFEADGIEMTYPHLNVHLDK